MPKEPADLSKIDMSTSKAPSTMTAKQPVDLSKYDVKNSSGSTKTAPRKKYNSGK